MKLSVAMAVYNGERFVREQLDSLSRQTILPDELIVSDDASTDRSLELVREFAATAPFAVKVLENARNAGCTKNFERAIRECKGDVIFISDWDDVWHAEKISRTVKALEAHPEAAVAICRWQPVDEELREIADDDRSELMWRALEDPELSKALIDGKEFNHWLPPAGCCAAFRGALKQLILPFPEGEAFSRGAYDYFLLWSILGSGAGGLALIPDRLVSYRRHRGATNFNQSAADFRGRFSAANQRQLFLLRAVLERSQSAIANQLCVNPSLRSALVSHWQTRCELPKSRSRRIFPLAKELAKGRYHRFESGFRTAIKDLLFDQ